MPILDNPLQRLQELTVGHTQRVLVALAGLPGSGKSTAAARLTSEVNAGLGPGTMTALGMDGFHLTKAQLRRMPNPEAALARRGAPWTFDVPALTTRLARLRAADGREAALWPGFEHGTGDPVEGAFSIPPETRLVLVEGLYLLCREDGWSAVSSLFDERWFLDTPLDIALARLSRRHQEAWGLTAEAADARIAANDRRNAEIVLRSRVFADRCLTD